MDNPLEITVRSVDNPMELSKEQLIQHVKNAEAIRNQALNKIRELSSQLEQYREALEAINLLATQKRKQHSGPGGADAMTQQRNYELYKQATEFKKLASEALKTTPQEALTLLIKRIKLATYQECIEAIAAKEEQTNKETGEYSDFESGLNRAKFIIQDLKKAVE